MYENCIAFLRRSVHHDAAKAEEQAEAEKLAQKAKEKKKSAKVQEHSHLGSKSIHATQSSHISPRTGSRKQSRADPNGSNGTEVPEQRAVATKAGPRESRAAKKDANTSEKALYNDAAQTLRKILKADAVAIVNIDEYQLFIRRASGLDHDIDKRKIKEKTKQDILTSFLAGRAWPEDIDPVIHHVPRSNTSGVSVLGTASSGGSGSFHFNRPGSEKTMTEFLETWLKTRHFWWDRENAEDELSHRIVDLMPNDAQTILGSAFLTGEGRCKFAMFASWNRPPSEFSDSQTTALPFAWILGGCTMAALAIRQVRHLEQSQISYSNLQAQ
jgi:hypothetical protein